MIRAVVPKKQKKPKRPSLPSLITKADTLTSLYIRQKYADDYGNVRCVTCGKVIPWKESHCAHYIERAAKATRWLEENLHPACPSCNVFRKEFHKREYTLFIIDFYGREKIDEFKQLAAKVLSAGQVRQLAEEAIEYYSAPIRESSPVTETHYYTQDSVMDAYEQIEQFEKEHG